MSASFTHLHLHTQYSLLDGAIRIAQLPAALHAKGFSACAITDHGNLFGAVEFYTTLKRAGIKPIIGVEVYVALGSRTKRSYDPPHFHASHLVLLCQNREGYQNLIQLVSQSYLDGKYYGVPRVDRELLERYHAGLIALSSHGRGVLGTPLRNGSEQEALEAARWYAQVFDKRFYIEVQDHGLAWEQELNAQLLPIAQSLSLPLVGSNDCHYLTPEEGYAHYLLQLMGRQRKVTDPGVAPYLDKGLYLKSPAEMEEALVTWPAETLTHTARIAEQCELELDEKKNYLPKYEVPAGLEEAAFFRQKVKEGLEQRLAHMEAMGLLEGESMEVFRQPYLQRLQHELEVITGMNYSGYFLIVADFINWAKNNGVRVGPGRGSGAGSLVAYAMRITDLDPIRHGLIFERFLNPERVSMPDFDVDFDVAGRERVIDYVREKYGSEKMCQISTFGTLGAKAALRGVARVLDFPYSQADKIAKLIPNVLNITLEEAIASDPELARLEREGDENERKLIATGKVLEGLNSTHSTHAAGVIIMDTEITGVMPICTLAKSEGLQSMYGMKWAEHQGAVKFDFLGLLNLTIIQQSLELINRERTDEPLDIDAVPLDDPLTFQLLGKAETTGVFQLESSGMRRLLMEMKPTTFEDIVALLALYRPGTLDTGMHIDYVRRKHGELRVEYLHPRLKSVLKETYGIMVYQEQVIEAARVLADFTLGEADILRRAMGKKDEAEMAKQRDKFVRGCLANDIPPAKGEEIFSYINSFAGYGFNKSHSVAYGLISYQTAYLKAHYPVQFMAALLSSNMGNTDKVVHFIAECKGMGIKILPPDINRSDVGFTIEGEAVRFGLSAVKNVGENAVRVLLKARAGLPEGCFGSLEDLVKHVDFHRVNKRVLEALVKCGALDGFVPERLRLLEGLEAVVMLGMNYRELHVEGQSSLLDMLDQTEAAKLELRVELPDVPPLTPKQRLRLEKEALGFCISGHFLDRYHSEVAALTVSTHAVREGEYEDEAELTLGGVVAQKTLRMSRASEKFAILRMEDLRGSLEVVVFPQLYAQVHELLELDQPLLFKGRLRVNEDEISLVAASVTSLEQFRAEHASCCTLLLPGEWPEEHLRKLMGIFSKSPGQCRLRLQAQAANGYHVWIDSGLRFSPAETLLEEVEPLLEGQTIRFDYLPS